MYSFETEVSSTCRSVHYDCIKIVSREIGVSDIRIVVNLPTLLLLVTKIFSTYLSVPKLTRILDTTSLPSRRNNRSSPVERLFPSTPVYTTLTVLAPTKTSGWSPQI